MGKLDNETRGGLYDTFTVHRGDLVYWFRCRGDLSLIDGPYRVGRKFEKGGTWFCELRNIDSNALLHAKVGIAKLLPTNKVISRGMNRTRFLPLYLTKEGRLEDFRHDRPLDRG